MTATASEVKNFFWHCLVAAKLMDEVTENTVTKAHVLHAVRMATLCAVGRNGVQYASDEARVIKESNNKHWEQCNLIKEHIVPVSVVRARVYSELKRSRNGNDDPVPITLSDSDTQGLTLEVIGEFQKNPRAWEVARIIREWTLLAWITKNDEAKFDDKKRHGGISIRKVMPTGWTEEQDKFARYVACGIVLSPI